MLHPITMAISSKWLIPADQPPPACVGSFHGSFSAAAASQQSSGLEHLLQRGWFLYANMGTITNTTSTQRAYGAFLLDWVWVVECTCEFAVCTYSGMLLERFSDVSECLLCFRPIL